MAGDPEVRKALAFLRDLGEVSSSDDLREAAMICFESLPRSVRDIVNETPIDYVALAYRWNEGFLNEAQLLIQAKEMQRYSQFLERSYTKSELQKIT